MDEAFWQNRWVAGQIGFHEGKPNRFLLRFLDRLGAPGTVFVPLCGKSVDLDTLAARGFRVTGCEIVERAVTDYFDERGVAPSITRQTDREIYEIGPVRLVRGDVLTYEPEERFDAVFAVDVLEHVNDLGATLDMAKRHLKPGGLFGFLTHNQTLEAFTFLVWEGEYHTGFIPKGNHDFHKFITPEDLTKRLAERGLKVADIKGIHFDLGAKPPRVVESDDTTISYMGYAR